uniref:Uncharacterized protein n=1 Tax=viral metagenome TaxID=1070528 RepID=A0A6H1ZNS0_9ZZZZ
MGKLVHNDILDAALNVLETACTQISVCKDTPTTYGEATTLGTYMLAIKSTLTGADFLIADAAGGGRKTTISQQASISVTASGAATHICLMDVSAKLLYVTTCTSQALTSGNTVTIPAWTITIGDPT